MSSSRKFCQYALLGAFAIAVAGAPAFAQDADAAKKKAATQQQKKVEKPKNEKDTTSNYPSNQVPGNGY